MTSPRVLLIIPCFNEAGAILALLNDVAACNKPYTTLVIDDGSSDNTAIIAASRSKTVQLIRNLGIGGAVQTGIKYALRNDFDFCVQIDGDGQHPPTEIAKLLQTGLSTGASITIGSRYIDHASFRSTWARRLGSKVLAKALNALYGCNITDPTSGMRLMDRRAMTLFANRYPQDYPEPISLAWALQENLHIAETPVVMRARECGQSSIDSWKAASYMIRVLGYIFIAKLFYRNAI
jgi:glycosyltransferase involved in cell wall biosynthesis